MYKVLVGTIFIVQIHLKSHRLMHIAFLLYEKTMGIIYANLFSYNRKTM